MNTSRASIRLLLIVLTAFALLLTSCGGDDSGGDSDASGGDSGGGEQAAVDPAPDLTPDEVCDLISPEDLVAVVDGSNVRTETLDGPPQCSILYGNSDAVRDAGGANGTNLLIAVPTSEDLEGETGDAAIAVASQYAFFESDPEPVDIADGGSTNGEYLYFSTGGRVVGVAAGDGMTADQLIEVAQLAAPALAP